MSHLAPAVRPRTSVTHLSTTRLHLLLAVVAGVLGLATGTTAALVASAAVLAVVGLRAWVVHGGARVLADPQHAHPLDPAGDPGQGLAQAA
ncbi:hypothetical protein [Nocardioides abyssi]|uniref:Uncharacterized protein n=1 Tax=Nocardioides abyssi TaxID=3058370 RepID=A0ABT8EV67_9ACTN|nr:hypothetical protein [Nocardioides abyssi]MDN4161964.1 hypothetical protein [Nocardioides abyssi]